MYKCMYIQKLHEKYIIEQQVHKVRNLRKHIKILK